MMHSASRHRLLAIGLVALLGLGGAAAGIALRPDAPTATLPAVTRDAVRQATSLSDAFIAIAEAVTPAVVRIEAARASRANPAGQLRSVPGRTAPERALELTGGSGFIVTSDGYILTNHHVIANAERITVTLRDNRTLDAVVIGTDPMTDVAVIRVQARGLPAVALGNSDEARVGEWVLAVGNPGFADAASTLDFTVTGGIISAKGRPLNVLSANLEIEGGAASYAIEDFIQTDAVINPGNSGGPLVDLHGTVIGINTVIASTTGYSQGYGFAIPSNLAQRVMRDLIEHGYVRRPLLGVSIVDVNAEDAELYRLPAIAGVVVEDFTDDSPAWTAGLRRHDVIVAVDSTPIDRVGQLQRLVAQHEPGDVVPISVVRRGERLELNVRVVEAAGAGRQPPAVASGPRYPNGLGLEIEELTPVLARQLGYARPGGALIARVLPASAADARDIGANHRIVEIDDRPIESAEQARAILRKARPGQIVSFVIEYPDRRSYIANIRMP